MQTVVLKKITCKGTLRQVFYLSEAPSLPLDRVVSKSHPCNHNQNYETGNVEVTIVFFVLRIVPVSSNETVGL
jgi:hypothetical protein